MTKLNLPEPISAYFDADKRDGEAVARCFTREGVVQDEGQTHSGSAAIEAWKTAASAKFSYTSEPVAVEQKNGRYIVTSRLTMRPWRRGDRTDAACRPCLASLRVTQRDSSRHPHSRVPVCVR